MTMPAPETLAALIDRACQLSEEMLGHPPDRHYVAERTMIWLRALAPLWQRRI